jgi:hypothetical protein
MRVRTCRKRLRAFSLDNVTARQQLEGMARSRLTAVADHPPPPEDDHRCAGALDGPGVYQLLSEKYPAYPVARLFGDTAKPLPVWAELAPAEQWQDVEAPLGHLDLSKPVPNVRTWRYWEACDPRGEEEFKRHLDEWDRQLREVHAGQREHLKTWNQLTYDLGAMTRDEHGRLRLDCKLGTYYHSLSTSECLDGAERGIRSLARLHPRFHLATVGTARLAP